MVDILLQYVWRPMVRLWPTLNVRCTPPASGRTDIQQSISTSVGNKPRRRRPRYCSLPPALATVPEHEILPDTKPRRGRKNRSKKSCEVPLLGAVAGNLIVFLNMYNSFVYHDKNLFM